MSEFKREWRFIVAKVKHLTPEQCQQLVDLIGTFDHPPMECVVVESDWPNYEDTWKTIEQVTNGEYQSPYDLIEQQQKQIKEMSELCLTNGEVDEIKARQAEVSFKDGYTEGYHDYLGAGYSAIRKARNHATEVRNGKDGE